jgi:hypothetical protein
MAKAMANAISALLEPARRGVAAGCREPVAPA